MAATESIETPLIKVPLEHLRRVTKDRKHVADELAATLASVKALTESSGQGSAESAEELERLIATTQGLKRKLVGIAKQERESAQRCKARLDHLVAHEAPPSQSAMDWTRQRLDRLLVDHMLRSGYLKSATDLASTSGCEELVDRHLFVEAKVVLDGLQRRDCSAGLAWCEEHHARLRKQKSKLEFGLRMQEFLELVRQQQPTRALLYARKHFMPFAEAHFPEMRRAVTALAFGADTTCARYAELFDPSRWDLLAELFQQDLFRMHSLTPRSLLDLHLQAGLSALKTPHSYSMAASRDDPLSSQAYQTLAEQLPFAKHVHSKLLCHVTKELMDDDNVPMVMPNGTVYSQRAVRRLSSDSGMFTCPKSGVCCDVGALQRAYIL